MTSKRNIDEYKIKYLFNQLKNKDLSEEKQKELEMMKDIYINNVPKKDVYNKYSTSRTTLWRIEKRFDKTYSSNQVYSDVKLNGNKLTDAQRSHLHKYLSKKPICSGIPFFEWNADNLQCYIEHKFGVSYSARQCYNILSNYVNKSNEDILFMIKNTYPSWYFVDIFHGGDKIKEFETHENGSCSVGYSLPIYMAIAVKDMEIYYAKPSSTVRKLKKKTKFELLELLAKEFPRKDKVLLLVMNKSIEYTEALEFNENHSNITLLLFSTESEVKECFHEDYLSDLDYEKRNIMNYISKENISFKARIKERINKIK